MRRDKTGTEKGMKEVYIEGVASHDGPDDVAYAGNGGAVAGEYASGLRSGVRASRCDLGPPRNRLVNHPG